MVRGEGGECAGGEGGECAEDSDGFLAVITRECLWKEVCMCVCVCVLGREGGSRVCVRWSSVYEGKIHV